MLISVERRVTPLAIIPTTNHGKEWTVIDFTPTAEADWLILPTAHTLAKAKKIKPHSSLSIEH